MAGRRISIFASVSAFHLKVSIMLMVFYAKLYVQLTHQFKLVFHYMMQKNYVALLKDLQPTPIKPTHPINMKLKMCQPIETEKDVLD